MRIPYISFVNILFQTFLIIILIRCKSQEDHIIAEASVVFHNIEMLTDSSYIIGDKLVGEAYLVEYKNEVVSITINLTGVPEPGFHAVHIHSGYCNESNKSWNQNENNSFCNVLSLGEVWARPAAGDIGNIKIILQGNSELAVSSDLWSLTSHDKKNIIGKVIDIHQIDEDFAQECFQDHDHTHINPKIACGIIELNHYD